MKIQAEHFYKKAKGNRWLRPLIIWGTVFLCTMVLVSLCFNEGLDYDEAYSYRTVHDNTLTGIWSAILQAHDTDIPLWYSALKIWTWFFGESWMAYKLFALSGTVATMVLGATVIRKIWGFWTSLLFIIPVSLSPALMHISVNIRMYSWTVFLVTVCALTAYLLKQNPERGRLWVLLFFTTWAALFSHYFTAFCHLFIYLYLLIELSRTGRKHIWKIFASGIAAMIPFCIWLLRADFLHLAQSGESSTAAISMDKVNFEDLFWFVFHTNVKFSHLMGVGILLAAFIGLFFLRKKFQKGEGGFVLLCLGILMISYLVSALLASAANHFFIPRHIMHGVGLMWLGIAIVLPKMNWRVCAAYLLFLVTMGVSAYGISYATEYKTTPYLKETKKFIAENMEPGDIVLYNSDHRFGLLYGCYMPEQIFYYLPYAPDFEELKDKRVWFFRCRPEFLPEETLETYGITYENMGHYGFQLMEGNTDFDLLKLEIRGKLE